MRRQPPMARIEAAQRRAALIPTACRRERIPAAQWPDGRRWCAGCQTFVLLEDASGSRCRGCSSIASHLSRLRNEFGIDPLTYKHLFELQSGRCAICRGRPRTTRLAADHDHSCCPAGKRPLCGRCTRGLLCSRCNHELLGAAHESRQILVNALAYLTDPPASGSWELPPLERESNREQYGTDNAPSF